MATITPQAVAVGGTAITFASASGGGDVVATGGNDTTLIVKNGAGSPINVTLVGARACNFGGLHDVVVAVAAGAEKQIPITAQSIDRTNGHVAVTYSSATTVTVAATHD